MVLLIMHYNVTFFIGSFSFIGQIVSVIDDNSTLKFIVIVLLKWHVGVCLCQRAVSCCFKTSSLKESFCIFKTFFKYV